MCSHRLPSQEIIDWVAREIVPLEPELRFWLRRMRISEPDDLVQDLYCRILSLESVAHIVAPRAYVFQMARNLISDNLRRSALVRFETARSLEEMSVPDTGASPETIASARAELMWVLKLIAALPDRCRAVFELRKVKGLSQAETAKSLRLSENVVEKETARGLQIISDIVKRSERTPRTAKAPVRETWRTHG